MKLLTIALCASILMSSNCKKPTVVDIPQDLLVQILTAGEWSITEYKLNGVDKTTDFAGWRVKFYENKTAEAKFNTNVMNTGTWDGNQSSMNFSVSFPSATQPVVLTNGTWHVDQPGTRIVVSSQTSGSDVMTMKLYRE